MKYFIFTFITAVIIWSCGTHQEERSDQQTEDKPISGVVDLVLPEGFSSFIVMDSLGSRARHLAISKEGNAYVKMESLDTHRGIVALKDNDQDGKWDIIGSFGDYVGTEVKLYNGYLYASSDTAIFRYKLVEGAVLPDTANQEAVVTGFPKQNEHASKTFTFDGSGNLFVNVGAPANACQVENRVAGSPGMDPCPLLRKHAGIWKFDANKVNQAHADGKRYVTGIRNCVALDWNKSVNSLFAVQHGRDQLAEFWPSIYDSVQSAELPAEEFLQMSEGDDFGWPYCYFDHLKAEKVLGPEYGGDGIEVGRCSDKKKPILGFPGHLAPNSLLFYTGDQFPERYKHGAFIAFHGSWNRKPLPQKGFFIAFVPFSEGEISGEWEIFADGFAGPGEIINPGDAIHRPVGLAQGPEGALYVSDSQMGRIWKISYHQEDK